MPIGDLVLHYIFFLRLTELVLGPSAEIVLDAQLACPRARFTPHFPDDDGSPSDYDRVSGVRFDERHVYLDSTGLFKDAVIAILAVIAKQERLRRSERASAAIAKLRRQGKAERLGRPRLILDRAKIRRLRQQGQSVRRIADELGISHMTVRRIVTERASGAP